MIKQNKNTEVLFMCDVEADGPIPGPYSMNSFGLVPFATRSRDEGYKFLDLNKNIDKFYAELQPISENFLPAAIAVGGFDHEKLKITGEKPEDAMSNVSDWVNETTAKLGGKMAVFTAFPLGFDWIFMYWYLVSFSKSPSPFSFSRHLDLKTEYASRANVGISSAVKQLMPRHLFNKNMVHTHNALDDALEQAYLAQNILQWDGKN